MTTNMADQIPDMCPKSTPVSFCFPTQKRLLRMASLREDARQTEVNCGLGPT